MDNFTNDRFPDSHAVCLIGHGSRDPEGVQEFLILWKKLRERKICRITECGFLEFAKPTVAEALSACCRNGIKHIIILPYILLSGEHTQRDIPDAVREGFRDHPEISLLFATPLGTRTEVMEVCRERIKEAENFSPKSIPRSETLLMTVAHGSRDADCNFQVEKNFQSLCKKLGFGKAVTHFAGISQHSIEDTLEKLMPQEFRRVLLLPFFLLPGVWVKRVHALVDPFQRKYPNTEFLKISCLKHHERIIDALIHQARESISNK